MDDDVITELGERLRLIAYDGPHLERRLGRVPARLTPSAVAVAEQRAGEDELGQAIRLWSLGLPLGAEAAAQALGSVTIGSLAACGLLAADEEVRAELRISPVMGRLHVHDFDRGGGLSRDHVVGVGPAALTLSGITPRRQVERALDLGTGCGVQAFGLARHASTVIATDISERAAWTARVGAALNGLDELDVRVGDLLEPVADEDFDLIVCNPPFVISPSNELAFRDGGAAGDALSRRLVRELSGRLRRGGVACILVNWVVPDGTAAVDVPRAWIDDLAADVLLLHHEELEPVAYAERWAQLTDGTGLAANRAELERWLAELQRLRAASVAAGAFVIRRTDTPARWRVARMQKRPAAGGPQVQRMLDAFGRFSGPDDPQLATSAFRLVAAHRVEQRLWYGSTKYAAGAATMRLERSAGVLATVPADLLEAVFLIDGIAGDVAGARGVPVASLRPDLWRLALELFELGFLEIVEPGQTT